ncbi:MAG: sodium/proline symporter [Saprospiraceae bacterium]|nr:sodium/proline symporter [Saprospiraceae bacterium]
MITQILVLLVYVSILFLIGIWASRRINSMSDFYVGGKNIGVWAVTFSARATGESGWLLIGVTGMGALAGVSAYWIVVGEVLGVAASWFLMAKRFKRKTDDYKSITVPDYLESHFRTPTHRLRILAACVLAVFTTIFVSSQIDATGIAFESFLGVDYYQGAILGFLIVLIYIFVGGFVAVVWSDLFQGLLMFVGLLLLPAVAWISMKGPVGIWEQLHVIDPRMTNIWGGFADPWMNVFTIMGFAMIGLGFLGSPQVYVRFMSIREESLIDKGRWIAILFTLLTDAAAVTIGILARVFFTENGQDPEAIFGIGGTDVLKMLAEQFLPYTLFAVYVAIVLSAIMSTIDSLLVLASSAIVRDFYQKIFRPDLKDEELTRISRWVTVTIALIALGLAMTIALLSPERQIFWVIIFGWSGIAATFCPVIILSLFWKGYSEQGAIASMISGFLCVPLFKFYFQRLPDIGGYFVQLDVLAPSFLIAMLFGYVFSRRYPPSKAKG